MKSVVDFEDSLGDFPEIEQKNKISNQRIEARSRQVEDCIKISLANPKVENHPVRTPQSAGRSKLVL
jgi:hypothetical protein